MKNVWFVTSDDATDFEIDNMYGKIFENKEQAESYALDKQAEDADAEYYIYEMHYIGKTFVPKPKIIFDV